MEGHVPVFVSVFHDFAGGLGLPVKDPQTPQCQVLLRHLGEWVHIRSAMKGFLQRVKVRRG